MELYSTDKLWVLSDNFSFHPPSQSDVHKIMNATKWMVASYSMMFYIALFLLGALSVCFQTCVRICSSQIMPLVFLVGGLMDFMSIFTNSHNLQLKIYFRLAAGLLIDRNCVNDIWRCTILCGNRLRTLQKHQPSMGFIVAGITIPLIIVECFLLVQEKPRFTAQSQKSLWPFIVSDKLVFLLQKIIQAIICCKDTKHFALIS